MPLVLYLKGRHHTLGDLSFLLCELLRGYVCVCIYIYIWKFPSQVLNLSCSCDLCLSCSNAGFLSYCSAVGIPIVLYFTFSFMIHFELIFVRGIRFVSRFIFSAYGYPVFQHHLLKRLSLLCCIAFALFFGGGHTHGIWRFPG